MHSFLAEVMAICRAHVAALGGNALVAYQLTECILQDTLHKNQVSQFLANSNICLVCNVYHLLRCYPFMRSTRRGDQAQVDACGRGKRGSSPMWTCTRKIKIRVRLTSSCLLLMQRSLCLFYQKHFYSVERQNKTWKFFCDIN